MVTYHCPYCRRLITHRPHLAGTKVKCSACGGGYFEPTDPLPGVAPTKAEDDIDDPPPMATLVAAPVLTRAANAEETFVDQPTDDDSDAGATEKGAKRLRSSHVLMPYQDAGQKAVVVSWKDDDPSSTKLGTTKNTTKEEGSEVILRVALRLIKQRWPEIYPLLSVRMDKSYGEGE